MDELSAVAEVINEKVESLFDVENNGSAVGNAELKPESVEGMPSSTSSSEDLVVATAPTVAPTIATDPKSAFVDLPEMLSMARDAFWKGNLQESEKRYQDMISVDDSNPDTYGELGNV